ncbi:MAG TPA: TetR family transcriptional regulator [Solirubrobacteraceae bacterium]|nr:TetR family transcriptional regulator [Solirubrobacteraceae bacterium]
MATLQTSDTRERILHATLRVIAEHGVGAVSNRRVAAEADVALGSLTYHFPSQTTLLRESLMLHVAEEVTRLEAVAASLRASKPTPADAAAEVERVVRASAGDLEPIAELELHLQAARDPELRDASRRCFEAYENFAAAALEALGVPDAARHAPSIVALMSGLALRRLGTGEREGTGTADALLTLIRGAGAA